jgi:hypothetical protein
MSLIRANFNPSPRDLRLFGRLWLPLLLAIMGAVSIYKSGASNVSGLLFAAAVAISLIGWLKASLIRPIFIAMMGLTWPIGWVVSHLALGLIFYGVITPIGLTMRAMGRDPLRLKADPAAQSHWTPLHHDDGVKNYFRQY